jgi:hypothetical protein
MLNVCRFLTYLATIDDVAFVILSDHQLEWLLVAAVIRESSEICVDHTHGELLALLKIKNISEKDERFKSSLQV